MAVPPLTFLERKWKSSVSMGNGDRMIRSSRPQTNRQWQTLIESDTARNVSHHGRKLLATLAKLLYWNFSSVRAAVNDMAQLAAESMVPQFEGADQGWGKAAEDWMFEHDKICCMRGWPYDMRTMCENLIVACVVPGDEGIALIKNEQGYPFFMAVPNHRIGSSQDGEVVKGGPFDGARQIDGVIVNDQLAPLAFRVQTGHGESGVSDILARDMFLMFDPYVSDMVRGISILGASAFDWDDMADARRFELIAQKLGAAIALIENNEEGEANSTRALVDNSSDNFDTSQKRTATATETIDGVQVRYFRSGTDSKIESLKFDRPSANQQAFRADALREALNGLGWSFDFSHDPTKAGGAQMRVVMEKVNRKLERIRDVIITKARRRMDGFRLACAIQLGELPANPEWWRWSYQGPARLTADAKYDSDVDIQERKSGVSTLARSAARRGEYWRDVRGQRDIEADDLLTRAGALAAKHKISIELALSILEKPDANPIQSAADSEQGAPSAPAAP